MSLKYDFTFAENAIKYLESGNSEYLTKIANSEAAQHILGHARRFNYNVPKGSALELVTHLLTPLDKHKEKLPQVVRNLDYAKNHIANTGIAAATALQYLPTGFAFTGSIFFTFGYDIGVAFGHNCSLNLAHNIFAANMHELKYYAIHEIHHAGFITLKDGYMPSQAAPTRGEMANIISYLTHLEGTGTYAPLAIRQQENALNADGDYMGDYAALQDTSHMRSLVKEYFEIYNYFHDNPSEPLVEADGDKINILSDEKRLWYIVGAHMARTIDAQLGRDKLTSLIREPSENFVNIYLTLRNN